MKNGAQPEGKKAVGGREHAAPLIMAASLDTENNRLLEIENLSKRFGDSTVPTNISFSVRAKEIVGVIGPNGAGKTTLLECIAGLLHPDSGTITWQKRALPAASGKGTCFTYRMGSCRMVNSPREPS